MTTKKLDNEEFIISSDGIIRVAIIEGDIEINNQSDLPKDQLLYYIDKVIIRGTGIIKYY